MLLIMVYCTLSHFMYFLYYLCFILACCVNFVLFIVTTLPGQEKQGIDWKSFLVDATLQPESDGFSCSSGFLRLFCCSTSIAFTLLCRHEYNASYIRVFARQCNNQNSAESCVL